MNNWYEDKNTAMLQILAEDAGAPELRNPRNGGLRAKGLFARLAKTIRG